MEKVFLRTEFNYDREEASRSSGLSCPEPTLAQQSPKDECDINTIVTRFGLGYEMPQGVVAPSYGDFTGVVDFQTAMNAVIEAERSFMTLHADVRARFNNEPQRFLEFCDKAENAEELIKLGLASKRPEPVKPEPVEVRVVSEPVVS